MLQRLERPHSPAQRLANLFLFFGANTAATLLSLAAICKYQQARLHYRKPSRR
jgi:hypothetical protein